MGDVRLERGRGHHRGEAPKKFFVFFARNEGQLLLRLGCHAAFAFGSSLRTKLSMISSPTPITMAVSAMLKAGQ